MSRSTINNLLKAAVLILFFYIAVKWLFINPGLLQKNHRYTIATIQSISYPADGGPDANFVYCINGKTYHRYADINVEKEKIIAGARFLLEYYPPKPSICRILFDKRITDTISLPNDLDTCNNANKN
jgi:hypothetical protein